jgi:hypothetical protein
MSPPRAGAFTIVELMVSMAVLVLIMLLIGQLFNSATATTSLAGNRMDADSQARAVFDRMSIDIAGMVKRADVDYFLKDAAAQPQAGNDQMAFYSLVPGYFPASISGSSQSSVSLVGYRVLSDSASPYFNQLQRYGYGLVWNGISSTGSSAMVFSTASTSDLPNTISLGWAPATNMAADSQHYEAIGPDVFRFEYIYVLKGTSSLNPSILSDMPWDIRLGHGSVNGMQDVAAIRVVIAVIDPKSRNIVPVAQLTASQPGSLANQMADFDPQTYPHVGDLEAHWESVIDGAINSGGIPRNAASSVRIYSRDFPLSQNPSFQE